ncbi:hypothetical protein JHK87_004338 [Glycine soja]|nr:hypothetical protein JHK87_004338 [Glycine soja]
MLEEGEASIRNHSFPPLPFSITPFTKYYPLAINIPSTTLQPSKLKVPTQASSLTHLSLSTTTPPPSKTSFKSTNPLHAPLSIAPHRPRDPPNATPLRRAALIWFCNDLRLLDNECLTATNNDSLSVLPIYFFDPSDYGKSASDFDKTGPYRAAFLIDSVSDLRRSLQARNSDLIVRVKKPETVLVELAKVSYPKCCKKEKRDKLLEMMEVRENVTSNMLLVAKLVNEKLGKVISKLLSRIKALEEFLNPICVMKSASLKVLELGKLCDNKGLTYRTYQRLQIKRASSIRIKLHQSLHQTDEEHDYENGTLE